MIVGKNMKLDDLKAACKELGLSVSGTKAKLQKTLDDYYAQQEADPSRHIVGKPTTRKPANKGLRDPNNPNYNYNGNWIGPPSSKRSH